MQRALAALHAFPASVRRNAAVDVMASRMDHGSVVVEVAWRKNRLLFRRLSWDTARVSQRQPASALDQPLFGSWTRQERVSRLSFPPFFLCRI